MNDSFSKERFQDIKEMISDNLAIGTLITVNESLKLLPIFRVKINCLFIDKQEKINGGSNANINVFPIGFLQIIGDNVKVILLSQNTELIKNVPNILETLGDSFNITEIFKKIS